MGGQPGTAGAVGGLGNRNLTPAQAIGILAVMLIGAWLARDPAKEELELFNNAILKNTIATEISVDAEFSKQIDACSTDATPGPCLRTAADHFAEGYRGCAKRLSLAELKAQDVRQVRDDWVKYYEGMADNEEAFSVAFASNDTAAQTACKQRRRLLQQSRSDAVNRIDTLARAHGLERKKH